MKAFTVVAALSFALLTVPVIAQQKPPATKPPAAAPQTQKPATPTPAQPPAAPRPFPDGAKVAYCSLNVIAQQSKEGQAAFQRVKTLQEAKLKAIQDKNKQMEADQALINSPSVADDKRAALQKEVTRLETEIQRMQQDAQNEVNELQQELQVTFGNRVMPIIEQVAKEKGLQMILRIEEAGIIWVDTGLDLSSEIVKRLDASAAAPTAPKQPGQ
jgi:outer membrane protein